MQMFLQLAGYLGIPVIGWNADNSGLERRVGFSSPSQTYNIICFFLGSNKKRLAHHQNHRVARNENFYIFQSHGSSLRVQLAPSLEHQVAAMIAIMFRFSYSVIHVMKYNTRITKIHNTNKQDHQ